MAEFIGGLGGVLNAARRKAVDTAFSKIERHAGSRGEGVPIDTLQECLDVAWQTEVSEGLVDEDDVKVHVMRTFQDDADGLITRDEFMSHCEGLSATIDGDAMFADVIRRSWHPPR